jgi:hypothetical protein
MTRIYLGIVMGALLLGANGCAAAYTNIEATGENEYRLVEQRAAFFRVKGVMLKCEGQGTTMQCKEVAVD